MSFKLQNYNEFKDVRWYDYISLMLNEFAVVLVRRYDFGLHAEKMTSKFHVQILGFTFT